jgi:hypothetical protein
LDTALNYRYRRVKSYYVAIGFQESGFPGQDLVKALFYGSAGQKMEGKGFLATYALFTLDEAGGRGELAKLKRADGQ